MTRRLLSIVTIISVIAATLSSPSRAQQLVRTKDSQKFVWIGSTSSTPTKSGRISRAGDRFYLLDSQTGSVIQCSEAPLICKPIPGSTRASDGNVSQRYAPGRIAKATPDWNREHPNDKFLIYTLDSVTGSIQTCGDVELVCVLTPDISATPADRVHIAILYRHADTAGIAGRLYDRIVARYGRDSVFLDVHSIPLASNWREVARSNYAKADFILALIGPDWLVPRGGNKSRLFDENDPVRMEIETAMKASVTIVPVLVAGAMMPRWSDLPDSIKSFSDINASVLDDGAAFDFHVERIFRLIDDVAAKGKAGRP
jgi:hypothetical protein